MLMFAKYLKCYFDKFANSQNATSFKNPVRYKTELGF